MRLEGAFASSPRSYPPATALSPSTALTLASLSRCLPWSLVRRMEVSPATYMMIDRGGRRGKNNGRPLVTMCPVDNKQHGEFRQTSSPAQTQLCECVPVGNHLAQGEGRGDWWRCHWTRVVMMCYYVHTIGEFRRTAAGRRSMLDLDAGDRGGAGLQAFACAFPRRPACQLPSV